ncbi:MAG: SH3 domain-containing protein [Planctomycetes bacterium]|nr:SH3 domain-containing protein [Planctomycetota bacterium]
MRTSLFATLIIVVCHHVVAEAQESKVYQAIVEIDGEYVRSGPGPNFYPTDKLRKGDKVTVHRHDPGGWCMITPPPGSFSWIRAEHVQRSGESAGVLKQNNVVVHVGSALSADEFTTIQGSLSKGDAVQILGERQFPFEGGSKLMYKISPVRREWRWIQRKAIVAADAIQSEPFPNDTPRKKPSGPVADVQVGDAFAQPISTGDSVTGPGGSSPKSKPRTNGQTNIINTEADGFQERLDAVDTQFREMIKQEPSTWNLTEIERQYTQLDNEATQPAQSRTIAVRLDAVSRYQQTQSKYANFLRISDEAKQRDAILAQQQREAESRLNGIPAEGPSTPVPQPQPQPGDVVASTGNNLTPESPRPAAVPKFAGAGIVVPMAQTFPGGPQFALVAPGGKLLAYLVPAAGVDLRRAVNQSMGIIGDRALRQEWGAEVITVRGLQPVRLANPSPAP